MVQEPGNLTIVVMLFLSLGLLGCIGTQTPTDNQTKISNVSTNLSNTSIAEAGFGTNLFETVQNTTENPIDNKIPDASPVGNETNPLKNVYKNPFE